MDTKKFLLNHKVIKLTRSSIKEISVILGKNPQESFLKTIKALLLILNEPRNNLRSKKEIRRAFEKRSNKILDALKTVDIDSVSIENVKDAMHLINSTNVTTTEHSNKVITTIYAQVCKNRQKSNFIKFFSGGVLTNAFKLSKEEVKVMRKNVK